LLLGPTLSVGGTAQESGVIAALEGSAPEEKKQEHNYQQEAEAPAIIVVGRSDIESTTAEYENQNDQYED
jgi:GTP cyclohydrolase III